MQVPGSADIPEGNSRRPETVSAEISPVRVIERERRRLSIPNRQCEPNSYKVLIQEDVRLGLAIHWGWEPEYRSQSGGLHPGRTLRARPQELRERGSPRLVRGQRSLDHR